MLTMRLDLMNANEVYLQSLERRLDRLGVVASTLGQEQTVNPDAIAKAYACHNECRKQQPPIELRQEPIAFDRWVTASPELYFIALHGREYVGVCMFESSALRPDTLLSGFTGVVADWNGRGVAKALKAHSLLYARRCGFRFIKTSNLVVNRAMCAINLSLGFQVVKKHLHSYPIPKN